MSSVLGRTVQLRLAVSGAGPMPSQVTNRLIVLNSRTDIQYFVRTAI